MRLTLFLAFFLLVITTSFAQRKIDFMVAPGTEGWNIVHKVEKGETIFMLSRRYHVPPAILADANGVTYSVSLKENSSIVVPLGAYNMQSVKPANMGDARALYYKVRPEDNLYKISRHTSVPQRTIAQWNNMMENEVRPGQTILVGWILYDATDVNTIPPAATTPGRVVTLVPRPSQTPQPRDTPKYVMHSPQQVVVSKDPVPVVVDSSIAPPPNSIEGLFKEQTQDGKNIVSEKGTAAFFTMSNSANGADVFAFHNKAAKGSVIRVKNINNGRIVYVKVLGPLPLTKQYYNCIIGLSAHAKATLGVREAKAFCELSYAGY